MKQYLFLNLAFSLLTACQEPSKIELKPFVPPPAPKKQQLTYEQPSGYVSMILTGPESEEAILPSQITVSFEKADDTTDKLSLTNIPVIENLLYSKNQETLSFGCDGAVEVTELPLKIDALKVVLCGKIKVPAVEFKLRASFLELRNAELTLVDIRPEPSIVGSDLALISTAHLTLRGSNKILLQGETVDQSRGRSPSLQLWLGNTLGEGTLDIFSRSSIYNLEY